MTSRRITWPESAVAFSDRHGDSLGEAVSRAEWAEVRANAPRIAMLLTLGIVLLWFAWSAARLSDSRAAAVCAEQYRRARTALDTARIDDVWPGRGRTKVRGNAATLRCGALRAAGRVPL